MNPDGGKRNDGIGCVRMRGSATAKDARGGPAARHALSGLARTGAALGLVLLLTACESAEQRAEDHYRDAMAFLQAGDTTRADLEFRNVFDLNGFHRDARAAYAAMLVDTGDERNAYGQYLRLVEQYPDDLEGRRALALLAAGRRDWEEARRHAEAGLALAPEDPGLRAAAAAVAYSAAVTEEDAAAGDAAADAARLALGVEPDLTIARLVLVDHLIRQGSEDLALETVDAGLELDPEGAELRRLRLALLARGGDEEALGAELERNIALFPDDEGMAATYLRFLIAQGDLDRAEAFLRDRIDPEAPTLEDRAALLEFLRTQRDSEAMRAELDAMIASPTPQGQPILRAMRAALDFEQGREDEALREMTALLEEAQAADQDGASGEGELTSQDLARLHVRLAQMRDATGDRVGARASVEEALAIDPAQPDALKVKASWLTDADDTGAAIATLRAALGAAPRDPEVMTLLARAHQRDGDENLAGEMLARAVEVSGSAPEESLRYASFLIGQDRTGPAASVLADALRLAPADVSLLSATGRLYVSERDWTRLGEIVERLRALPGEMAAAEADTLTALGLAAQERNDELESLLGEMAEGGGQRALGAETALIRAAVSAGDLEGAIRRADALVEGAPEDAERRLLRGALRVSLGEGPAGLEDLRGAVRLDPQSERAHLALVRAVREVEGKEAGVAAAVEAAAALPSSTALQWIWASDLELAGDLAGAIEVYEAIYALDPDSLVVANNLASLLSTTSDDPETLARAERIARRLRGSDTPAFRDTYGWILYRMGDAEGALPHLALAASGMSEDPRVRLHHATALAATGAADAARAELDAAVKLAGEDAGLLAEIEATRAELDAAPPQ